MKPEASVVIPVYNEAEVIRRNVEKLTGFLQDELPSHEVLLCENGSSDGTGEIARALAEEYDCVHSLFLPEPCLGEALKRGFEAATADKVVYMAIDLPVDLAFIPESVRLLDAFDGVVGSKRLAGDLDRRPRMRRVASRAFHGLVRGFYGVDYTDTTCVKAFRRSRILDVMDRVPSTSRVFETEVLVEAERLGLDIVEIPVSVAEMRTSRELLWSKVEGKLEGLLSTRLDRVALLIGAPMLLSGAFSIAVLTLEKLRRANPSGFVNPYSFLLSMLLVVSGFQFITLGLLTKLILQIRREVARSSERTS